MPPTSASANVSAEHHKAMGIANAIISEVKKQLDLGSANQDWNFAHPKDQSDEAAKRKNEASKRVQFLYHRASLYLRDELQRYVNRWEPAQQTAWVDARLAAYAKQLEEKKEPETDSLKQKFQRALTAALEQTGSEAGPAEPTDAAVRSAMDDLRRKVMREKPRLRALAARTVRAGNCDQMADLTFMRARELFPPDYLVQLIGVPGHTFCRVGKRHWQDQDFVVIDPWPREAYAILAGHHLGYCDKMVLWREKPALGADISKTKQARYAQFQRRMSFAFSDYETNTWASLKPIDWHWTGNDLHNCLFPTPADSRRSSRILSIRPIHRKRSGRRLCMKRWKRCWKRWTGSKRLLSTKRWKR